MFSAFCVQGCLAVVVLAAFGASERGTDVALQATGRFAFLLFWLAYAGGSTAKLFGERFEPLKRHGRDFGLCFASALSIHVGLVAWLCWIGHAPSVGVFEFFGVALAFTYLLALLSIKRVQLMLSRKAWWLLRIIGMNYIAYAFAVDFWNHPLRGGVKHVIEYLPFITLSIAGALLYFAALAAPIARLGRARLLNRSWR